MLHVTKRHDQVNANQNNEQEARKGDPITQENTRQQLRKLVDWEARERLMDKRKSLVVQAHVLQQGPQLAPESPQRSIYVPS